MALMACLRKGSFCSQFSELMRTRAKEGVGSGQERLRQDDPSQQ